MRFADLDAVTLDAYGTLVSLVDPVPKLASALSARGIDRTPDEIRAALEREIAYYGTHAVEGRDGDGLDQLRTECADVFLSALDAELDAAEFAPAFVAALEFALLPGVRETLESLHARGLALAVVSNWDSSLPEHLDRLGIGRLMSAVVTSADVGAEKPDPRPLQEALTRLGVEPGRVVHVGDRDADAESARAAGVRFLPAPLATAFRSGT